MPKKDLKKHTQSPQLEAAQEIQVPSEPSLDKAGFPVFSFLCFLIFTAILCLLLKNTIGFYYIPAIDQSAGYPVLFIIGMLTSFHCIAMCGGISFSQSLPKDGNELPGNIRPVLSKSLLYHLGRIVSYTLMGAIAGALGSMFSFQGTLLVIFKILMGIMVILSGLRMFGVKTPSVRVPVIPGAVKSFFAKCYKTDCPFLVGMLTVFMPCGPLQAMRLYALSTGSIVAGAISMLVFSLGTVPVTFGLSAILSVFIKKAGRVLMRVSAVLVFVLGVSLIFGALGLNGTFLSDYTSSNTVVIASVCVTEQITEQVVATDFVPGNTCPIMVQEAVPLKWTIHVEGKYLNPFNDEIIIPAYNIRQKLHEGDNIIEFTPAESGIITYANWLGLIGSRIKTVKNIDAITSEDIAEIGGVRINIQSLGCC